MPFPCWRKGSSQNSIKPTNLQNSNQNNKSKQWKPVGCVWLSRQEGSRKMKHRTKRLSPSPKCLPSKQVLSPHQKVMRGIVLIPSVGNFIIVVPLQGSLTCASIPLTWDKDGSNRRAPSDDWRGGSSCMGECSPSVNLVVNHEAFQRSIRAPWIGLRNEWTASVVAHAAVWPSKTT